MLYFDIFGKTMLQTDAHFAKMIHCKKYYDTMFVIFTVLTALYKSNGDYILQGYNAASSVITKQHFEGTHCLLVKVNKHLHLIATLLKQYNDLISSYLHTSCQCTKQTMSEFS